MKDIGEYLKEARINHGVSLEEAADDLSILSDLLENLEEGNTRAFKDIYELKDLVKEYSKYLGLDMERVENDFNDFLFEKTSKISLRDIIEARNVEKEEEEQKKVTSPYTNIPTRKIDVGPVVLVVLIIVLVCLVFYLFYISIGQDSGIVNELKGVIYNEVY